jgi:hypothetical protein
MLLSMETDETREEGKEKKADAASVSLLPQLWCERTDSGAGAGQGVLGVADASTDRRERRD